MEVHKEIFKPQQEQPSIQDFSAKLRGFLTLLSIS